MENEQTSSTDFAERAATLDGDLRGAPIGARAVRPRVEALQGLTKSNLSERSLADFSKQLRHFHDRLENLVDNSRGLRGALSGEPIPPGNVGVLHPADGGRLGELYAILADMDLSLNTAAAVLTDVQASIG